ncbi:MAG: hypothetical protein EOO60_05560 [Hymenobacter sp.]|nr:MAG: hypothetical protein EOO60_05560 [Hymenobacter sp.]
MEDRAPYQPEAPKGRRNLARFIAEWLRTQGFTATEAEQPTWATLRAHWTGSQGERFELDYTWASGAFAESNCRLRVRYAGQLTPEVLFTSQAVRRLKEVRLLLLGNRRYDAARLLARLAADFQKLAPST